MTYKAMYKCRMCKGEYALDCTSKVSDLAYVAERFSMGEVGRFSYGTEMRVCEKHNCQDGSIGYADFLGFKREN